MTSADLLPGTTVEVEFVRLPPLPGRAADAPPLWMARTETTWDAYDVYVHRLDEPAETRGADAVARPSKPYITYDRGFGHKGRPVISVSDYGARSFCEWLARKTGRAYRLPTEAEWALAASAGATTRWSFGDDAAQLDQHVWHRGNSGRKTQPVGGKLPNAWGLYDLYGNVAEWCTDAQGKGVLCGGSYLDPGERCDGTQRRPPSRSWNQSDPQLPKSKWWLADAGFTGFRMVVELDPATLKEVGAGSAAGK